MCGPGRLLLLSGPQFPQLDQSESFHSPAFQSQWAQGWKVSWKITETNQPHFKDGETEAGGGGGVTWPG